MICSGIWKSKTSFLTVWCDTWENWVAGIIEVVGLTERKDDQVKEYSGVMCRGFEIAWSLIHDPKWFFLMSEHWVLIQTE